MGRFRFVVLLSVAGAVVALGSRAEAFLLDEPAEQRGAGVAVTPNEFEGTDVERINKAIEVGASTGRRVVIPRINNTGRDSSREVWLLDSAILLRENTTLELDNCRIKLSDRCRDNMMRSANCGMGMTEIRSLRNIHIRGVGKAVLEGADRPRATGDNGKKLGERTYGTDAGVAGESQTGDWRNIGVLLAYVEDFSIQGITVVESHCWGISLERCAGGVLRDIQFQSGQAREIDGARQNVLNQDGIDLRLGCHDVLIENISGYTGDDLIAMTAIAGGKSGPGETGSTMVSGSVDRGEGRDDIRSVIVRNIRGYCPGGHHIVRLLNTTGIKMYDVLIDGLIDTTPEGARRCKAAVKIGDSGYGSGVAPLGDTRRIVVNNVISRAEHTILVGGSLCDSILSNLVRYGLPGEVVTIASGPEFIRNVKIVSALVASDSAEPKTQKDVGNAGK